MGRGRIAVQSIRLVTADKRARCGTTDVFQTDRDGIEIHMHFFENGVRRPTYILCSLREIICSIDFSLMVIF